MKATRRPLRDRQGVQEENDAANNNGLKKRKRSNKEEGEGEIIALEGNLQSIGSNVTFEFKDADDMHIESLTILLKTLVTNPTKAFEIATSLATDVKVGTIITCEGDVDTFALAFVVCPFHPQIAATPLKKMFDDIKSSHPILPAKDDQIGLFIYRKYSNLPLGLVAPLHQAVVDDFQWAVEGNIALSDLDTECNRRLTYVAYLAQLNSEGMSVSDVAVDITGRTSVVFDNFEDDIFHQRSVLSIVFRSSFSSRPLAAFFVPVNQLQSCVDEIKTLTA